MRSRAVPAGTVGGRMPRTSKPRRLQRRRPRASSARRRRAISGRICDPVGVAPSGASARSAVATASPERVAPLGLVGEDAQRLAHRRGHQRRRRGRKDEAAAAVDQEVAHDARPAHQRALAAQRLAAGAQRDDVLAAPSSRRGEPAAVRRRTRRSRAPRRSAARRRAGRRSRPARRAARGRRPCCRGFRPRSTACPVPPPARQSRDRVVERTARRCGAAATHAARPSRMPVMRAGMDQRVVDDQVAALRQGREQRCIGGIAAGEDTAPLSLPKKRRRLRLQRLMLRIVAAQQPRSARADRHAARRSPSRTASRRRGDPASPR